MNCFTIDAPKKSKQIKAQLTRAECNTNNNENVNLTAKMDYIADYFLLCPNKKADKKGSDKLTKRLLIEFEIFLEE